MKLTHVKTIKKNEITHVVTFTLKRFLRKPIKATANVYNGWAVDVFNGQGLGCTYEDNVILHPWIHEQVQKFITEKGAKPMVKTIKYVVKNVDQLGNASEKQYDLYDADYVCVESRTCTAAQIKEFVKKHKLKVLAPYEVYRAQKTQECNR